MAENRQVLSEDAGAAVWFLSNTHAHTHKTTPHAHNTPTTESEEVHGGRTFVERAEDAVLVAEEELFQPLDPPDVRTCAYASKRALDAIAHTWSHFSPDSRSCS